MHGTEAPSPWVRRWAHLIPTGSEVLDVACGHGRHMRHLASLGHGVTGIDRDPAAIEAAATLGQAVLADIENGPWPLPGRAYGGVIVTNYLWRPLLPRMVDSVAPGGVLIYETFGTEHARVGRPSRPDFLLQPGELLQACRDLRVVAYEDGFLDSPERFVQRIVALREDPADPAAGQRRRLDPAG
ncbi:bifunctional 2-polyprenyl-6-hydroxyphenol methylase/3-demethylubiquinol 3-O-methyltransferase UbiG [uncultured Hydrogenophaga sp.]|uniref:class I SAM-dependent methyltransferase n=1 Tax=uncultured Hydrogenophaga sp. TaxID=199683 RepID=UPI00266023D4|nr:class I SAM-dependent methyltransferase [uncultured Hydrogenophaga sp.]